ncbi:ATP synthase F0 subcomplex subunit H atp14 [Exophiala xenobiotica]|uniref:ATP synthase F0 subcomplex subunit H atp14 n=1 Tax=Lithohypha guttulata TaxID=1690604 RepID=A0ABR0KK91_9EURO|nr:ATP synthase F0 subcomplex subunit H atp14 [Lithohypha guttulata]KAK5320940.1 ATP synthase F0 subcomplex subunit H atp14 [Exophiala xenobiotica]
MSRSLRVTSSLAARLSSRSIYAPQRSFAVYAAARKPDLIQDMYLKSLREYKVPPQKASDAEGHVQKFTPPAAPKSPEETNLANDMKAYEDQVVEIEGQASASETQEPEEDYFEDLKHIDGKLSTGENHH